MPNARPNRIRRALAGALTICSLCLVVSASAATAAPTLAKQADSFVESVGVNVHLTYSNSPYNEFSKVNSALQGLGVRYIRDGVGLGRPDVYSHYRTLASEGIKLDMIVGDPLQRYGIGSVEQQLNMIATEFPEAVATLEGPNEYDQSGDPNWVNDLRNYQQALWEGAHARPALASKPILGPTVVRDQSRTELGNISQWTNQGNMHPYPGGLIPDSDSHATSEFSLAAINTATEPVEATETGYHNAVNFTTDGHRPTSERAAGIYMPRLFLDNFRRGVARTYAYELIDVEPDSSNTIEYRHFGLLRNDWTPKPAYTAVQRLIALLRDPGPNFRPESFDYSLQNAPSSVRQILLERRDGSFDLVLWNAVSVWDTTNLTDISPGVPTVNLNFGQSVAETQVYRPNDSAEPIATSGGAGSIPIALTPQVTVVHIVPGEPHTPEPGPPPTLELNQTPAAVIPVTSKPSTSASSASATTGSTGTTEVSSTPTHKLPPAKLKSILQAIRNGCHRNCPLRSDEVRRARPLLLEHRDLNLATSTNESEALVRWLQARVAQIQREAVKGGWGVENRGVRFQALVAVLRIAAPGSVAL